MISLNYSNKNLDSRLDGLVDLLKEHFRLTTKGVFTILLSYGLNNKEKIEPFTFKIKGKEFRSNTDPIYDVSIFILMTTHLRRSGKIDMLGEILEDNLKTEELINELVNIASAAGVTLLNNELSSYKGTVSKANKKYFVSDVINTLFIPLEEAELF